jgi:membrane associated rhomboid family serine protease
VVEGFLKRLSFKTGQDVSLLILIVINLIIFLFVGSVAIAGRLFDFYADWSHYALEMPLSLRMFIRCPWTIVTYMFTHYNAWHLLVNMLWLLWFGNIMLQTFSASRLIAVYIFGGLFGGLFYLLMPNLLSFSGVYGSTLCGASASVLAVMTVTALRSPNYPLSLFLIGVVKLKWIALASIILILYSVGGSIPAAFAHVGGIAFGVLYWLFLRKGRDILAFVDRLKSSKRETTVTAATVRSFIKKVDKSKVQEAFSEARLDMLLDKIRISGYSSLSDAEKSELNKLSKELKK